MIGVTGGGGFVGSHIDFADKKLDRGECPLDNFDKTLDILTLIYPFKYINHKI